MKPSPRLPDGRSRVMTALKIDPALKAAAQAEAAREGVSLTAVIERSLARYVARRKRTDPS